MKNYVQHGDTLDLTAPAGGVVSGSGYLIGALFIIAMVSVAAGEVFAARVVGVVALPKATGEAWAEGQVLYWDNGNKRLTATVASNTKVGCAIAVTPSVATSGSVRLNGIV